MAVRASRARASHVTSRRRAREERHQLVLAPRDGNLRRVRARHAAHRHRAAPYTRVLRRRRPGRAYLNLRVNCRGADSQRVKGPSLDQSPVHECFLSIRSIVSTAKELSYFFLSLYYHINIFYFYLILGYGLLKTRCWEQMPNFL